MIRLDTIRRSWGPFSIDVSLEAEAGEYLVILGPSGCGKSLLLGTMAGIYVPEAGRIELDGSDATSLPPEQRQIGFVFQKSALFPHLSVTGNIVFGLKVRRTPRSERRRRVEELVEDLGLSDLLGRPVATLSGGEAQKVAIARALAPRPRVLLLDEPLSLLDHNARLELQEELQRVHERTELTVIHVTHNREEARTLGQRCAVMLGGRIIQTGPLDQVFQRPRCLFVSRFLGVRDAEVPEAGCTELCLAGSGQCDRPYGSQIPAQDKTGAEQPRLEGGAARDKTGPKQPRLEEDP